MRIDHKKLLHGVILIVIGVIMILYAQHGLHPHISHESKPFFEGVRDWFMGVGDWFKGTVESKPQSPHATGLMITMWIGAVVTGIGALFVIFSVKKK